MRKYIIYKHTSPSGKVYIGQTCKKGSHRNFKWEYANNNLVIEEGGTQ